MFTSKYSLPKPGLLKKEPSDLSSMDMYTIIYDLLKKAYVPGWKYWHWDIGDGVYKYVNDFNPKYLNHLFTIKSANQACKMIPSLTEIKL